MCRRQMVILSQHFDLKEQVKYDCRCIFIVFMIAAGMYDVRLILNI